VFGYFGVIKDQLYWIDLFRRQMKSSDVDLLGEQFVRPKVQHGYRGTYIEPKGHGIYLNQSWSTKGLMIPGESTIKDFYSDRRLDKVERANNSVPYLATRKVRINEDIAQKEDVLAELLSFPRGKHDDCCDVLIDALKLAFGTKLSILDVLGNLSGALMGRR
jgi:predicted phage terminase large subunit-like protein